MESSKETVLSRDLLKELVDKELALENCSTAILSKESFQSLDSDVFGEILVDELKRENRDLKFALVARDQRLEDAANKVTQLVEQNTYLNQKVEKAAMEHTSQLRELIEAQKR